MLIYIHSNLRLSRARRVIENAFGIFVSRWRLFKTEINAHPKHVEAFTNAAIVLHNFLISNLSSYCPPSFCDSEDSAGEVILGHWRQQQSSDLQGLYFRNNARSTADAWTVRESFTKYFVNEGSVPWQVAHVTQTGNDCDEEFQEDELEDELE